jgi:hypothetical protein
VAHAQPKKSVVPIFRRMLASHERSLVAARGHSEPAGQIAAREMEFARAFPRKFAPQVPPAAQMELPLPA